MRSYTDSENQADSNLFKLYYFAFKGTRQLNWSKGLKKLVSKAEEKTDQEIVDDTDNVAEMLFKLDIEMWHAVRKQKTGRITGCCCRRSNAKKTYGTNTAMFSRSINA